MAIKERLVKFCVCERCKHEWIAETNLPETCSKCRSPYWNKPRKPKKQPTPPKTQTPKPPIRSTTTPIRTPPRPTRGRGGIFSTAARRDTPRPSKRQIDSAGIGGAT